MTIVLGMSDGGTWRNCSATRPAGSLMLGYVMPCACSYAVAASFSSRMFTPTKSTPCACVAAWTLWMSAASTRHGAHQEPQKFSTTTWPRSLARLYADPSSSVPLTAGAFGRSFAAYTFVAAAPDTKPLSEPFIWFTASLPVLHPAAMPSAAQATAITASARNRTGTRERMSSALRPQRGRRQRDEVGGRLGVPDPRDPGAAKVERREAGECALPPARVVPQPLALDVPAQHPDRQLMR